jgi:hypothetical protein
MNVDASQQGTFVLNAEGVSVYPACQKKSLFVTYARQEEEEEMNPIIVPIVLSNRI